MSVDTITDHLDLWSSALLAKSSAGRGGNGKRVEAYGIKKLRELILELAVRGKLVPQDLGDEPASVLLERVAEEAKQLKIDGKIKTSKSQKRPKSKDMPHELPNAWEWVSLSQLGEFCGGSTPSKSNAAYWNGNVPWVSPKDMKTDHISASELLVTNEALRETNLRLIPTGSILIVGRSGILKRLLPVAVNDIECTVNQDIKVIIPYFSEISEYLRLMLKGYESYILKVLVKGGVTVQSLKYDELSKQPFPFPPLAEQHRIVTKVDELMALCDRLEEEQTDSLEAHQRLVETLLGTLTNVESAQELNEAWARVAEHFDTLFTTEQSIDLLKQTILQLAVMGKLVLQDPADEPASVLLERIAAEKKRLVDEGKIKKQKALPEVSVDEQMFALPNGWEWSRLGVNCVVFSGNSFKSHDFNNEGGAKVIKITNAGVGEFIETDDYLPNEFVGEYKNYIVERNDLILALTRPYISSGLKISKCPNLYHMALLNQRVAAIRVLADVDFFFTYLQSAFVLNTYKKRFGSSGLQPNLKVSDVTELRVPVPPLAEQHRIVAKVDELMCLCDSLKEKLTHVKSTQIHLADAVVEQAVA